MLKLKGWQLLIVQVMAAFCAYLITSTTFVSALEIRIFTSGGQELSGTIPKFSDFILKEFSYPYQQNYQYIQIKLSSKNPAYLIKKVYVFKCKGFGPTQCMDNGIEPDIAVNAGSSNLVFDNMYKWDEVSSNSIGNFLTFIKLDIAGKEVWTGSWDKITKTGPGQFTSPPESYEADRLDVYLKAGVSGDTAKTYIENYYAVPSDQVNRSVFQGVSGSVVANLYDLSGSKDKIDPSGTGVPSFYPVKSGGNVFNKSLSTWDFVMAGNGKIANPAVFYSSESGPPTTGGASLVIDDWSPQVTTCWSGDVIRASMHADNASMGYFQSYYYTIDGMRGADGSVICSIINPNASIYSYQCSIPVAKFPACSAPGTSTIKVYFNYAGGVQVSGNFPVTLKAPAARLVVSSLMPVPFDCGIDKELTAKLQVSNPLEGSPKTEYTFDGKNFNKLNCSGSANTYTCAIAENGVCQLLQENLQLTFKLAYGETEVLSLPSNVLVTFPPPSLGIDTVTPQTVEAGKTTAVSVLLHVNYPDFVTYSTNSFNYKYLSKAFTPANCSLETSYSNIKYYKCGVTLEIPSTKQGVETLAFRLDGFMEGKPKQLTANSFFEIVPPPAEASLQIISTSSPLNCIQDPSLTVTARADNIQGTPTTAYSIDSGKTYKSLVCSPSGNVYTCTIAKDDLCSLMSSSLTLLLKFTYTSKELTSNPQNIYVNLPEPHVQVYSINPDTLSIGSKTAAAVSLYLQYPKMVGDNPVFLYTYLNKTNQKMTCTKVSSTSNRDFYDCANTQFEVPGDYAKTSLPVLFSVQGTTLSFPLNVPVSAGIEGTRPWLEIISTTPSRIEISQGNQTSASLYVTVHNAAENELKHQATVIANAWVSGGTCTEASVAYDFNCAVTLKVSKTASAGPTPVNITLRTADKKTYDVANTTTVYVIPEEAMVDVQSINPEALYCEGSKQQNPDTVKVTASTKNVATFTLLEEEISFNGLAIAHTARYCTQQGQTISCNIPTDKFFEKVACGTGELAAGGGAHYYPLTLSFLVNVGGEETTISGSKDVSIVARPLEAYLEIVDNDVVSGVLQSQINCLGSQAIKLGDGGGYVRIMYADLLHAEPKAEDVTWSFKLDAQDDKGKLTKGMGVSPTANATICKLLSYQKVGVHRVEDYECSLYLNYQLFQRCENGDGEVTLTATSGGKKAEGSFEARVVKDSRLYQLDMDILTNPASSIDCQINSEGKGVPCSLASDSNQNVTIRVYNRNANVEISDLTLYDFDIKFNTPPPVDSGVRSLGNCRKEANSDKYLCPFQIGPTIRLPDTAEYEVTNKSSQTELPAIGLGSLNVTVYVKYAGDLARETISKLDGTITIHPKKSNSMINSEKMREQMMKSFKSFQDIFKWVVFFLTTCGVCSLGNKIIDAVTASNTKCPDGAATEDKPSTAAFKTCAECVGNNLLWCQDDNTCRYFDEGCKGRIYNKDKEKCGTLGGGGTTGPGTVTSCTHNNCADCVTNNCFWCLTEHRCTSQGSTCIGTSTYKLTECPTTGTDTGGTPGEYLQPCKVCVNSQPAKCWCVHDVDDEPCKANCEDCTLGEGSDALISEQACSSHYSLASSSPSDYQPEASVTGFLADTPPADNTDKACKDSIWNTLIKAIPLVLLAIGAAFATGKAFETVGDIFHEDDKEKQQSEITKYMERGAALGFVTCVLPRLVGEFGELFTKGKTQKSFQSLSTAMSDVASVCNQLLGLMPLVMSLIQFWISYLRFEMCLDMVQRQVEMSGQTGAAGGNEAYQAQAATQAGVSIMTNMMSCFDQLTQGLSQLTTNMMWMNQYMNTLGGGTESVICYVNNEKVSCDNIIKVCDNDHLLITAEGFCKGGVSRVQLRMTSDGCKNMPKDEKQCSYNMPVMPSTYAGSYAWTQSRNDKVEVPYDTSATLCEDGATILTRVETDSQTKQSITAKYSKDPTKCGREQGVSTCTIDSQCGGLKCCKTETSGSDKICSDKSNCLCASSNDCAGDQFCCYYSQGKTLTKCSVPGSGCLCQDKTRGVGTCELNTCGTKEEITPSELSCPPNSGLHCCVQKTFLTAGQDCTGKENDCASTLKCCTTQKGGTTKTCVAQDTTCLKADGSDCQSNSECINFCCKGKCTAGATDPHQNCACTRPNKTNGDGCYTADQAPGTPRCDNVGTSGGCPTDFTWCCDMP